MTDEEVDPAAIANPSLCLEYRIDVANRVLETFAKGSTIERDGSHFVVAWTYCGKPMRKRWMTFGQDFYPVWHRKWTGGGTATTALSQLIRWCQGKPVLPLSSWRYWAGDKCKLLPSSAVDELAASGYPVDVDCVLCHQPIRGHLDWWSLDGVTGPCCGWTSGCQQKGASNVAS
jgi:hypothetical protein